MSGNGPTDQEANNTYTTLSLGTQDGDSMDESSIAYDSSPTTRKRERIVPAGDDGSIMSFHNIEALEPGAPILPRTAGQVLDSEAVELLGQLLIECRRQTALIRMLVGTMTEDIPDMAEVDSLVETDN